MWSVEATLNLALEKYLNALTAESDARVLFHVGFTTHLSSVEPSEDDEGVVKIAQTYVARLTLTVDYPDSTVLYMQSEDILAENVLDGDPVPLYHMADRLWEKIEFMQVCGGLEFDKEMERVASQADHPSSGQPVEEPVVEAEEPGDTPD